MKLNQFKTIFAGQINYDRKYQNEDSTDFSPYTKLVIGKLENDLNVETGATYRQDIQEENDDWFSENDPESNYQNFIKDHQKHFNLNCIYPMADDIDDYPAPLTHKQLWLYLNGDANKVIASLDY